MAPFLSIVVPTRNRPDLLPLVLRGMVRQQFEDYEVIVSDNSSPPQAQQTARVVEALGSDRVKYVRPDRELAMGAHWEWALGQACGDYQGFMTDRGTFKRGAFAAIASVLRGHDVKCLSFPFDRVFGSTAPFHLLQANYTGRVIEYETGSLLRLVASSRGPLNLLPRLMNAFIRRSVLDDMRARYGRVTDSGSPDFYFAFLACDYLASIHHWDLPATTYFASARGNGFGFAQGKPNQAVADYLAFARQTTEPTDWLVPGLWTPWAGVLSEYEKVRKLQTSERFVQVDPGGFYRRVRGELAQQSRLDGGLRASNASTLEKFRQAHGLPRLSAVQAIKTQCGAAARSERAMAHVVPILYFLADKFGLDFFDIYEYALVVGAFQDFSQALQHAEDHPRSPSLCATYQQPGLVFSQQGGNPSVGDRPVATFLSTSSSL